MILENLLLCIYEYLYAFAVVFKLQSSSCIVHHIKRIKTSNNNRLNQSQYLPLQISKIYEINFLVCLYHFSRTGINFDHTFYPISRELLLHYFSAIRRIIHWWICASSWYVMDKRVSIPPYSVCWSQIYIHTHRESRWVCVMQRSFGYTIR